MQNKIIAIAAAATLGFLSTSALAAPVTAQNTTNNSYAYAGIQSGLNLLHMNDSAHTTADNKAANKNTKAGFAVGGVMGYSFNPYLRSDLSVDYLRNAKKQTDAEKKVDDGASAHGNQLFVLANVYGSYPVTAKFSPFAGVGVGYAHTATVTKVDKTAKASDQKDSTTYSANGLGLQATAGINYAVTSSLDLSASYRMLMAHTGEQTAKDTDSKDKNHVTSYNNVIGMSLSYRLPM